MTSISFAFVSQAADFINAGKNPWMTIKDGAVQGVYVNRDAARAAKNGAPSKYNFEGMTMSESPQGLPTGEAVADGMQLARNAAEAGIGQSAKDVGHTIDDTGLKDVDISGVEANQDPDAAEFAADKAAGVETGMPTTQPIPPVAPAPVLPADAVVKSKPDVRHQSEIMRPTKMVWHIADRMVDEAKKAGKPAPTRKEVMAECDRLGIAFYTARTQYQVWKSMQP